MKEIVTDADEFQIVFLKSDLKVRLLKKGKEVLQLLALRVAVR